ncbi:right-handed parallel beta-helix repeat-containing protein [Metabacillus niabensis]|uniref:right-handed parallel beta-helix repeat-containing protein n=1 Tax=Metabacillus niabensis TaxID=324854 RepID=UPI001CFAC503|nr:right-handed parallel beta-helix repeat-containing protein [Metabacillus niabensis]
MVSSNATYVVELDRWGMKKDGTDAVNTTKGLNDAIVWAAQNNFIEIILPRGTYLIDEYNTIEPQSFMTLNLNGSTLKVRDNNRIHYAIISFQRNQRFSRVTNGIIEGDKETHDYSSGGTHEAGYGIQVGSFTPPSNGGNNTRFITLDNLEILNCTGDAITINSTFGQIFPTPVDFASSWEQGSISTIDGTLIQNPSKIRSTLKIDMNQLAIKKYGYFGLYGNGYGDLGSDIITDYYDVFFYNSDNTFLSSRKQVQFFDEVEVPIKADYAKIQLHQSKIPVSNNCLINVRVPSFPQHTYINKCDLHHCRRQGISICGTKYIYIRENEIHHIGGTPPQAGIDIEDGYDLNQFIYINSNNFHHNNFYDVVVVNGKSIFIAENKISYTLSEGASLAINGGADKVSITSNILYKAKVILSGEVIFANNNLYGTQLNVLGTYKNRPLNLYNNLFHNSKLVVNNPFAYLVKIDGCRFYNDSDKINAFSNLQWTLELINEPQVISNCTFEGHDVYYLTYANSSKFKGGWIFENIIFNNVKNPALFAGRYINCTFKNVDFLDIISNENDGLELIDCKISSEDINNSLLILKNIKSFKMKNCIFNKSSGTILRLQNIVDEVIMKDNIIKVTNDVHPRPIILIESSFSGNLIIIENNFLSATKINQVGIQNSTTNNAVIVIKNNILRMASINSINKSIIENNIINGIIEP